MTGALLLAGLVALAAIVALLAYRRVVFYRRAIGYDIRADYVLPGDPAATITEIGDPCRGTLSWPAAVNGCSAALLEITVNATMLGSIVDPFIETAIGARTLRHYVERGARGRRFLNVTALVQDSGGIAGAKLLLRARHLQLSPAIARLHIYERDAPVTAPVLVLAPHPDDAEIAAFGVLMRHDSWVMTVTIGDNGPSHYAEFFDNARDAYSEKGAVRVWDSLTIPQLAGVPAAHIGNLGYFDGTLPAMFASPDTPVAGVFTGNTDLRLQRRHPLDAGGGPSAATWRNLVADMRNLLEAIRPATIIAPHPELDPHGDHRFTTIAMLEALEAAPMRGRMLLYANHARGSELYPYGRNDGEVPPPPNLVGDARFSKILSLPLDRHQQLRKRLAIEAQHDLKPPPSAKHVRLARAIRHALQGIHRFIVQPDNDYVRRAARPSELYFVVDYGDAAALRHSALRAHADGTSSVP